MTPPLVGIKTFISCGWPPSSFWIASFLLSIPALKHASGVSDICVTGYRLKRSDQGPHLQISPVPLLEKRVIHLHIPCYTFLGELLQSLQYQPASSYPRLSSFFFLSIKLIPTKPLNTKKNHQAWSTVTMVVEYNGTGMTGGDSLTEDINIYYDVSLHFWEVSRY